MRELGGEPGEGRLCLQDLGRARPNSSGLQTKCSVQVCVWNSQDPHMPPPRVVLASKAAQPSRAPRGVRSRVR